MSGFFNFLNNSDTMKDIGSKGTNTNIHTENIKDYNRD